MLLIRYLAPTSPSGWNSIDFPQNLLRILNTCIFHPRSGSYKVLSYSILKHFQEPAHISRNIATFVYSLFSDRTWLQVQPEPSACTPEMGGWWLTWEFETYVNRTQPDPINLLCNISEALVLPDALKGLPKEGVERLVAGSSIARPICWDGESCDPPANAFGLEIFWRGFEHIWMYFEDAVF